MKTKAILAVMLMALGASVMAQTHVRGYTKKDGTYVAPHYRSSPNSTRNDNYSTRGNVNPYTGKEGTKAPDNGYYTPPSQPAQPIYSQPSTIANPYAQPAPPPSQPLYQPSQRY
ncbi:hypothetical protein [Massilia sp. NP310]|uniref:hypothetical protein n=1 Tax=Massilia sp. NP310 TaxID=2861282 RepID=UPI001C6322EF|nr:hypothetical protein [Massilia sp. NP310]QYG04662.1 hypothetical protein KY496_11060 [Massilia sp. NP310]